MTMRTLDITADEILPGDLVPTYRGQREVDDVDQDTVTSPDGRSYGLTVVVYLKRPTFGDPEVVYFAPGERVCVERAA